MREGEDVLIEIVDDEISCSLVVRCGDSVFVPSSVRIKSLDSFRERTTANAPETHSFDGGTFCWIEFLNLSRNPTLLALLFRVDEVVYDDCDIGIFSINVFYVDTNTITPKDLLFDFLL